MPAYGGGVYAADTSAWARSGHPAVQHEWQEALRSRQLATTPIVQLELLYTARDGSDLGRLATMLGTLRDVPLTDSVTNAASTAMRELAHVHPLHHRSVKLPDLLIAASAQDAAIGVLHYGAHFDLLAGVLDFESRWIAPRGSL